MKTPCSQPSDWTTSGTVRVRPRTGPRRKAEVALLGIDGPETAVGPDVQPGDVLADRVHLPALVLQRRLEHGQVGLAASAGEGRGHVGHVALGRFQPQY